MDTDTDKETVAEATTIAEGVSKVLRAYVLNNDGVEWDLKGLENENEFSLEEMNQLIMDEGHIQIERKEADEVSQPDDSRLIHNLWVEVPGRDRAIAGQSLTNRSQTYGRPVIVDLSL